MLHRLDNEYVSKFGCCYQCGIDFVEQNQAVWNSGVRPTSNQLKESIVKRRPPILRIE